MAIGISTPFRILLAGVIATHAAFVAEYYRLTDGCFCAILASGLPVHRTLPGEIFFLRNVIALPIDLLPLTLPAAVPDPLRTVLLVLANAALWFVGLAALITLTRRLFRYSRSPRKDVLARNAG